MKRIIIQGDDLGYKPEVDAGIKYAYEEGILTSTTVMANLLKKSDKSKYQTYLDSLENKSRIKKPKLGVGVHLNVTYGRPLSKSWPYREFTRPYKGTGRKEEWQGSAWKSYFSQFTVNQIEDEYRRQIELAVHIFGKIDHLDSHQFTASYFPLKEVFIKLAREYKLAVRPSAPLSEIPVYGGDFVVDESFIDEMKSNGVKVADKYSVKLFFNEESPQNSFLESISQLSDKKSLEVMFHPAYGQLAEPWRVIDLSTLTSELTLEYISDSEIELINYEML